MTPILSIVIVEYRSLWEIADCVASLKSRISVPAEIIVSSNSCYDEHEKMLIDQTDEQVRWLFNSRNGGFAYAMNRGLQAAKGRFLAIMNSDCQLSTPLDPMLNFMQSHAEVGAIGPKMVDAEGNIQDTARPYVTVPRYIWRQVRRIAGHKTSILTRKMDYTQTQTVDWLIGAFIMVSRKSYEATGGLDDRYFMYAEDLDWCTRIRQQGFEVVYCPKAIIIYKGTRRARNNRKYARIFIKSHLRYWIKFGFFFGHPKRKAVVFG